MTDWNADQSLKVYLFYNFFIFMATGKVKWFNTQKGFGFIVQEDNKDLFVHFKDVLGGIESLKENDAVEFEVAEGRKGLQAVNVKKV